MLITIITVCFNAVEVIERTLVSVIRQNFTDAEYIVIDGNSKDGTVDIIKKYQYKLAWFLTEPDTGIYQAMNKGIRLAKGDYCLFLNAGDTLINKDVLSDIAPLLTGESVITGNMIAIQDGRIQDFILPPDSIDFPFLCINCLSHQASFIKTVLLKAHLYDESLSIASDWKFWFEQLLLNHESYKPVDIDISVFARGGISTRDSSGLAAREREKVISDAMGAKGVSHFRHLRKRNTTPFLYFRIKRRFMRVYRLFKFRHHFDKMESFR
jgi:glycosyltransferase involved in cell wall biosynthesis